MKKTYVMPEFDVLDVQVEQGFAASNEQMQETPGEWASETYHTIGDPTLLSEW